MNVLWTVLAPALLATGANPYDVKLAPPRIGGPTAEVSVFARQGTLRPGARDDTSFILPRLPEMYVLVLGTDLSWSFRSPTGSVFSPGDSAGHRVQGFGSMALRLSGFLLEQPESGKWVVAVASRADTALQYGIVVRSNRPTEEAAHLELVPPGYDPRLSPLAHPGDRVFVRAFVTRNAQTVTGTQWRIQARTVRDSAFSVPVFDDGSHADGKAGDGVFVGSFVTEGPDGFYRVAAEGRTPAGVRYAVSGTIEIQTKNDLIMKGPILVTPSSPKAGEPVRLTVTVMNDGTDDFKDTPLELDVDDEKVSEQRVDLKPNVPRRVETTWVPRRAGRFEVKLILSSYDEPYWSDLSNSHLTTIIEVK